MERCHADGHPSCRERSRASSHPSRWRRLADDLLPGGLHGAAVVGRMARLRQVVAGVGSPGTRVHPRMLGVQRDPVRSASMPAQVVTPEIRSWRRAWLIASSRPVSPASTAPCGRSSALGTSARRQRRRPGLSCRPSGRRCRPWGLSTWRRRAAWPSLRPWPCRPSPSGRV